MLAAIDRICMIVVTIATGESNRSGFLISLNLILANHHVISSQNIVKTCLVTGLENLGESVRAHPERDVAVVQVEQAGHQFLSIWTTPPKSA